MSNTLATPLTPDQQTIVDIFAIQQALKQGFQMASNGANALENVIKQVQARANPGSADIVTEGNALLASLRETIANLKTQSGVS